MENKAQLKRDYEEAAREIDKEISRIDETFKTIEKVVAPYKSREHKNGDVNQKSHPSPTPSSLPIFFQIE